MGLSFWIRRYLTVLVIAFAILTTIHWLKGNNVQVSLEFGLLWSLITTTVFTAARIYHSRRGQHCAICKDTPEMQGSVGRDL